MRQLAGGGEGPVRLPLTTTALIPVPALRLHREVRGGPGALQGATQTVRVPALPAEPAAGDDCG